MLILAAFVVTSTGCKKTGTPATKSAVDAQTIDTKPLSTLRLLWRLPGIEATQSLLTTNTPGHVFLAVKETGDHTWDLCGIDVPHGPAKWCSRLSHRADIALSVVADKAIVHDPAGNVTAYDLETGQFQWAMRLDCEIQPKNLRAVGNGLALARCGRGAFVTGGSVRASLVAIDLNHGKESWRHDLPTYDARLFILGEKLIAGLAHGINRPRSPPDLPRRTARGLRLFPPPHSWPDANALVGSPESGWTILSVTTGENLPTGVLGRPPGANDGHTTPYFTTESLFSDSVVVFDQDKDGAKLNTFLREGPWECQPALYDPWS